MPEIRIEVKADRTLAQLDRIIATLPEAARRASHKGAEQIKNNAQHILSLEHAPGTKSPSPPGAPPARITGELADTILVSDMGDGSEVGPTAHYGRFLELGGTHEGHMRWFEDGEWHRARVLHKGPRPYMKPARDASLPEIHEIAVREIRDAIRAAVG
jgi:hypothetical protein